MSDPNGRLIFLHGASSSGKSTLISALRPLLPTPFWHLSIDHLRDSGAWDMSYFDTHALPWRTYRPAFFDGFHAIVASALRAGNDVILEHILDTAGWHDALRKQFAGLDVFFVGLMTEPEVLINREQERGDRPVGSAVKDHETIHSGLSYDLTLSGQVDPNKNAQTLVKAWDRRSKSSKFFERSST